MPGPNRTPVESTDSSTDLLPANIRSTVPRLSRRAVLAGGLGTAVAAVVPSVLGGGLTASRGVAGTLRDLSLTANERASTASLAPRVRSDCTCRRRPRVGPSTST